jgi:hypothetical protein
LLFIAAPSLLCAESIDHLNPRWTGTQWEANRLELTNLAYQRAFFPQVTQGPGRMQMPKNEACLIRIAILSTNVGREEKIAQLWGRIHGKKEIPLATLCQRGGALVWRCPTSDAGDCLFDAPADVELSTGRIYPNTWETFDVIISPAAYQQMFGWNSPNLAPSDPAKSRKGAIRVARQLSPAAWEITRLEILSLRAVWIGRVEILPADAPPLTVSPNIWKR